MRFNLVARFFYLVPNVLFRYYFFISLIERLICSIYYQSSNSAKTASGNLLSFTAQSGLQKTYLHLPELMTQSATYLHQIVAKPASAFYFLFASAFCCPLQANILSAKCCLISIILLSSGNYWRFAAFVAIYAPSRATLPHLLHLEFLSSIAIAFCFKSLLKNSMPDSVLRILVYTRLLITK